jgi:phage gpG-like protein
MRGDFAKLAKLQAQLKEITTEDTRTRLSNVVGASTLARVQRGFRSSTSPYGEAWEPLKIRAGGKPLLDTGRMRSSISYQPRGDGFEIGTNFIGAAVHQFGATIEPKHAKWLRYSGKNRQTRGKGGRFTSSASWIFSKRSVIPARPFMPSSSQGIPDAWLRDMNAAGQRFFSRIFKG